MYKVIVRHLLSEDFDDYFTAKSRATHLYLQGYEVTIEQDGKVINSFIRLVGGINEKDL